MFIAEKKKLRYGEDIKFYSCYTVSNRQSQDPNPGI